MITGKYLSGTIGNTTIAGMFSWEAEEVSDSLDAQTGAHAGFSANEHGSKTLRVTFELHQDIETGIYSTVQAGTTITDLKLYRDTGNTSLAANVPTFNVFSSRQGAQIKTSFVTRVSGEAFGSYTMSNPS